MNHQNRIFCATAFVFHIFAPILNRQLTANTKHGQFYPRLYHSTKRKGRQFYQNCRPFMAEGAGFDLPCGAGRVAALRRPRRLIHSRSRSNPDLSIRKQSGTRPDCFRVGGGCRIRTRVGFRPNGFQDRPVMTASVTLREAPFLYHTPREVSRRALFGPAFSTGSVRFPGERVIDRADGLAAARDRAGARRGELPHQRRIA